MIPVPDVLARLEADRESGRLAELCRKQGIDLLVLFGSARLRPETAGDVDLAYYFADGKGDELAVVNAFGERYGDDAIDMMPLDRGKVVARHEALTKCDVLVELTPGKFASRQISTMGEYRDTQWMRDMQLEALAR